MRKNLLIGVAVVAVLAALPFIAGCAPEEGAPPEEEVPEEAEPIQIGVPEKITGYFASEGSSALQGITMAVEEINAAGGVLGRKLEISVFDIEDVLAEKVIASAEELVVKRKVDMVISGWAGAVGVEVYGEYDVPYLHYNAEHTSWEYVRDNPEFWNCFVLGPCDVDYTESSVDAILRFPWGFPNKRLGFIAGDWEWERLYRDNTVEYTAQFGWECVLYEDMTHGMTNYRPLMTKVKEAQPSLLFFESLSTADSWNFYREFVKDPTNTLLTFGWAVSYPEYIELVGEEGNGIIGYGGCAPRHSQKGREYVARVEKRWGHENVNGVLTTVYDGVYMWANAVEHVGDVTDYRAICKYIEDYDYEGIIGTYDYQPNHRLFFSDDFPLVILQIQNGKVVELYWQTVPVTEWILPPYLEQFR